MPDYETTQAGSGDVTLPVRSDAPERTPDEVAALLFGDIGEPESTHSPADTIPVGETTPTTALRAGAELGRYRVVHELGRGGMGVVYRALDHKLGREVALKVLLVEERVGQESIDRFQREALAAAALDHPNIIKVLDVGRLPARNGSYPFYTMELLTGEDLGHAIARGHVTPREAVEVTRQVASALAYAHGRGILHRDVKPHNIFLRSSETRPTPTPAASDAATVASTKKPSTTTRATIHRKEEVIHALLLDFGLAKLTEGEFASGFGDDGKATMASLTRSGEILGTPVYMPPEQVRSARSLDSRADIYALGATLYHALTGRPPFDQATLAELLEAVQQVDPRSPRAVNPKIDGDLETLCMKCLAKEPKHRYPTAEDLAEDCARYLAGEQLLARPVGVLGRLWRKARRNRQVARLVIGLGVAVLAVVGLVLNYTIVPAIQARAEAKRKEEAREARRRDAEATLAACRAAAGRGDTAAAEDAANRIVEQYTDDAERGEDLPVAEAHVELAQLRMAGGDARGALVELYRAFERVVGTPRAAPALARIGEHLLAMDEVERAQGVFARALEERPDDASRRAAEWGLARCLAGRSEFDEARSTLESLLPQAAAEERAEMKRLLAFLSLVTPGIEVPVSLHDYDVGDLDGDGKPEIVAIADDGRSVVVGAIEKGAFAQAHRVPVLSGTPYGLNEVQALDVDGRKGCEVVVGGGVPGSGPGKGEGSCAVLTLKGGELRVTGRAVVPSELRGRPFAAGDLDGDGTRELVIGTSWYDRSIHVFRVLEEGLSPVCQIPVGGDVWAVLARDADADGLAEIWAFAGPWQAYSLQCWEYDRAQGAIVRQTSTPLGREMSVDVGDGGLAPLVGVLWAADSLRPLQNIMGHAGPERTYRAPGVYELRFLPDLKVEAAPIWELPWPTERAIGGTVAALTGPDGRFAWACSIGHLETGDTADAERGQARVYAAEAGGWRQVLGVRATSYQSTFARAHDIDGDGDTELVVVVPGVEGAVGRIGGLRILGMGGRTSSTGPAAAPATAAVGQLPPRTGSPALLAGREADRLGLPEEAARKYQEVIARPVSQEDLEEAALALVRALARLGRLAEAAQFVTTTAERFPQLRLSLQHRLLAEADEVGEWAIALGAARDLMTAPGLSHQEARDLTERVRRLGQLANPSRSIAVGEASFDSADLLATSPLFVRREAGGVLRVYSGAETDDALFVPAAYDGTGLRVVAEVAPERHDWEANLEIGVAAGDPWAPALMKEAQSAAWVDTPRPPRLFCAFFESSGDTYAPIRRWLCAGYFGGKRRDDWVHGLEAAGGEAASLNLEYAPHQRRVRCRVALPGRGETGELPNAFLDDERVFLAVLARGIAGVPGHWGVFRVSGLRLESGSPNVRPTPYTPRRAVDHLMLANGRWVQARTEDARALYERAIVMADLERAHAAELSKAGLPSDLDAQWAQRYVKWVHVDARFWRALFRASLDDMKGALEDLDAAFALSKDRVDGLLVASALSLKERPKEAAAIRACLCRRGGFDERSELRSFGEKLLEVDGGADLAASLLVDKGFEVRAVLVVEEVRASKGAPPLEAGDLLLSYDGRAIREFAAFREAQSKARDDGKTVPIVALRRGRTVRAEVDPREVVLTVRVTWEIVAKGR